MNSQGNIARKKKIKRRLIAWGKGLVITYCAIGIILYYLQEKLMFHPDPLPHDYTYKFDTPFKEVNIAFNARDTLNLVQFFPASGSCKGIVLYFHGNRGNINRYAKYAINFTKNDYQVWMIDYPGYGKTTGKLTEDNLYNQAREFYKLAHSKFESDSIIIFGKSLGSGVAAWLASKNNCKRLILETPYYSMPSLFSHYAPIYPTSAMAHFKLPTYKYLREVHAPVTIFHGTADDVIPYDNSHKLANEFKKGDEFITVENGNHNNLNDFPKFHEKLDSLLSD